MAKPSPALILVLANTVLSAGAVGFLAYSKLIYKRPVITESGERQRLAQAHASPPAPTIPGTVIFEPTTVNIEAQPSHPKPVDGPKQIQGKLHYATVGFALEIRDESKKEQIEVLRPLIMDKFLTTLGHKNFRELSTVQGRYVLRTQIIDLVNHLVATRMEEQSKGEHRPSSSRDGLVTNVYFTQFIVQ